MGKQFQYTSLDRVLSKIYRDLGLEEVSETDIVEWSGEALSAIGAPGLYEDAVAFIEVNNHYASLPSGIVNIYQVARNNNFTKKDCCLCPINIKEDNITDSLPVYNCGEGRFPENLAPGTDLKNTPLHPQDLVPLDKNGSPIFDVELAYYRPYFDLQYEYHGWQNSRYYSKNYTPVRLANHSFFGAIVSQEHEELYYQDKDYRFDEYTIADDRLKLSFKEGSVAVSYSRQKVDEETGYPMIPDDYSVITAITMYITMKYMARMWYSGREGYGDKYQKAEQDWHWYCKQAGNIIDMPYSIDDYQNILEERQHLIPRIDRYYGFFGKLGRKENQSFKDPDNRNKRASY